MVNNLNMIPNYDYEIEKKYHPENFKEDEDDEVVQGVAGEEKEE